MKLLLDFLPVLLFFAVFKYAEGHKEWATSLVNDNLAFMISGGSTGPDEAPVLLATVVVILATAAQISFLLLSRKKVDLMLWISLGLVTVMGGATIWFHDNTFIQWKPSVLYWVMAVTFLGSQILFRKNLLKATMGDQIEVPPDIWTRLNTACVGFFTGMGFLNLYIAHRFDFSTWAKFKTFGIIGLMLVFFLGLGVYITKHAKETPGEAPPKPEDAA